MNKIGLVVIGRNEGENLRQCLLSVLGKVTNLVYADSGSTDGSVELVRSLGVDVVELDPSEPFSVARGRTEGLIYLLKYNPHLEYVQFLDGDCELVDGWLDKAQNTLDTRPDLAVVFGWTRERFPERSIYQKLCDLEWNTHTTIGETKACGGIAMMRIAAFQQVGGLNLTLRGGEDEELCLRLRQQGWKILRLDAEMVLHDAQMTQFSQWWQRMVRAGYSYAQRTWLHSASLEGYYVKENLSIWFWGFVLPLLCLSLFVPTSGISLLFLAGYSILIYRIYRYMKERGFTSADSLLHIQFCILGKFPQVQGQIQFYLDKLFSFVT